MFCVTAAVVVSMMGAVSVTRTVLLRGADGKPGSDVGEAAHLDNDGLLDQRREAVGSGREGVGAGGELFEVEAAGFGSLCVALQSGGRVAQGDLRVGDGAAFGVEDGFRRSRLRWWTGRGSGSKGRRAMRTAARS